MGLGISVGAQRSLASSAVLELTKFCVVPRAHQINPHPLYRIRQYNLKTKIRPKTLYSQFAVYLEFATSAFGSLWVTLREVLQMTSNTLSDIYIHII